MTTPELTALMEALKSRYGLNLVDDGYWNELKLQGGIAMSPALFSSLVEAAKKYSDTSVTFYEMESVDVSMAPIEIDLDYESFRQLKGNVISHFDLAMVPPSKRWIVLLTNELETSVYGTVEFLSEIARSQGE